MTFSTLGTDTTTHQSVYLYKASRTQGLYIVGLQGMGKSGLLENLISDDIKQGTGVCVLDPHGELIDHVIARLPGKAEEEKVIYLDIKNMLYFFGLPLLDCADLNAELSVENTRSQFLHVFEKAFGITEANPVMYTLLSNIAYTLIANPGYTMIDIRQLLTNRTCRESLLQNRFLLVHKSSVIDFWHTHYDQLSPQRQDEESFYILNKLNDFENAPLRYIVGQSRSTINLQEIMDQGKILLVKLSRQLEQATSLIGSIIVALILNASAARTTHKQFHLYADEFQRFATEDFATLLEEARKAGIGITMAHQNRAQLELSDRQADKQLKARTLNVGSLVVFRVPTDAVALAGQFDTTPPPAEPRIEYKRTPSSKPVDFIVSGKSHPNEVVNTMLRNWKGVVEKANESIRDIRIPAGTGRWGRQEYVFVSNQSVILDTKDHLQLLNDLLYKVMLEKNPRQVVPIVLMFWMAKTFDLPFFDYNRYSQLQDYLHKKEMHELTWGKTICCEKRFCKGACGKVVHCDFNSLINFRNGYRNWYKHRLPCSDLADFYPMRDYFSFLLDTFAWGEERKRTEEDIKLYILLWLAEDDQLDSVLALYEQHIRSLLRRDLLYPVLYFLDEIHYFGDSSPWTKYPHEEHQDFPDPEHIHNTESWETREAMKLQKLLGCEWLQLDFAILQWEKEGIQTQVVTKRDYYQNMGNLLRELPANRNEREFLASLPDVEDTYHKWAWMLKPGQVTPEVIESFLQAEIDRIITEQKPAFETLVRQLRHVMQALATQPIEDISGVVEEKPGTTMTYADVTNQIANELVKLDQYTARVKLTDASDTIVEHTLATREPEKGVYGKHLDDRIERIELHTRTAGYTRPRHDVEDEIKQRQSQCSGGSSPAQPQKPQRPPQPQGRLIPICSRCGSQNQPGANFCNQCGEKI